MDRNEETHNETNEYVNQQCECSDSPITSNGNNKYIHIEIGSHICGTCDKRFKFNWNLRRHERTYKSKKPYQCEFCEDKFGHKGSPKYHVMAMHERYKSNKNLYIEDVSYKCEKCNKEFKNKAHLHIHERTHKDERSYHCEFCGQMFRINLQIQYHNKDRD